LKQSTGGRHEPFNLGSGVGCSVRQAIDSIGRLAGRPVPHVFGDRRPGDSPKLVGNIAKAQHELGWHPGRSIEAQIEDTLRWRRVMSR
jgi:UDP-glucose 4-epimerase